MDVQVYIKFLVQIFGPSRAKIKVYSKNAELKVLQASLEKKIFFEKYSEKKIKKRRKLTKKSPKKYVQTVFYGNTISFNDFQLYILKIWTISNIFYNIYFYPGVCLHPEKSNSKKLLFFQNGGRYGIRKK